MIDPQEPIRRRDKALGAGFVAVAIFLQIRIMGPAASLLGLALIAAYALWALKRPTHDRAAVLPLYLLGISVQCLHFGEEYLTDFPRKFSRLFGYTWTNSLFVAFNLAWLSVFALAAAGVSRRIPLADLVVYFFAIGGGMGNGIGHLALATARGGYFPGAWTAPASLVVGWLLLAKLLGGTPARAAPESIQPPANRILREP